jgi:hypothetical protein
MEASDDRPRGLAPFQVHPEGEQLFAVPAQLYEGR